MDWHPNQWKMKNISSSHSIQVCCLSPFTSPVTVSGKRKAVLVSALHCCLIDPEKPSSRSRYEEEGNKYDFTLFHLDIDHVDWQGLCLLLEQALHGASWSVSADKVYRLQRLTQALATKDGMDGNVVELPFPPCDFEVPAEYLDKIRHLEEQITCDRTGQQHQYSQENDTEKAGRRP
ncbi:hypothetical protein NC651_029842 [Populus alba x Populus x berolinensis]|nr:hypothetical protein NC651_029842 [Populus alba x Populus x berolinensis]